MSARGQYGGSNSYRFKAPPVSVGARLVHTLELKQRYDNARAGAVQSLLNDLSKSGVVSTIGSNRWEIALKDGAWVRLQWYPDWSALEVTILDQEMHPAEHVSPVRRRYETILRRITPPLETYGATTVGGAIHIEAPAPSHPRVGITLYHSVGDRAEAVKQLDVDWNALYQTLASQAGDLTADPTSPSGYRIATQADWDRSPPDPKKVAWWKSYANPLIKQWVKFKHDQIGGDRTFADSYLSFAERFQTNWDVYEGWKKKLDALRAEAQSRGFTVDAPTPMELPTSVWSDVSAVIERGASKVAAGVGDTWTFVKYGAWAALGIGALVALSSVASNLRKGRDPAEKYVQLIRSRRALPRRRDQLALPPGDLALENV